MRVRAAIFLIVLTLSGPLQARGRYYFHKAKVNDETFKSDAAECQRLMGGARTIGPDTLYIPSNPNLTTAQNAAVVGIASFFAGMMRSAASRKTKNAVERTCMADKGYERFSVPDALADEIEDLPNPQDRLARYFALAAAENPVGERMVE
jgi:hypothetical protein